MPFTDLLSIDGWPLEQPPLWGVAWPQLCVLAETNKVVQLMHLNTLEQKKGNNLRMSNDTMVSVRIKIELCASLGKL